MAEDGARCRAAVEDSSVQSSRRGSRRVRRAGSTNSSPAHHRQQEELEALDQERDLVLPRRERLILHRRAQVVATSFFMQVPGVR